MHDRETGRRPVNLQPGLGHVARRLQARKDTKAVLPEAAAQQRDRRLIQVFLSGGANAKAHSANPVRDAGTAALMVSHDLAQVRRVADQVTLIDRVVRRSGSPAAVLADNLAASFALDAGL